MPRWADIPQLTQEPGQLPVDVGLREIESQLEWYRHLSNKGLRLRPDFQRGHVWSEEQQIAYVEHLLRGGRGSQTIRWNCIGYNKDYTGPVELVDGLQRLTACRKFVAGRLRAFGYRISDYEGPVPYRYGLKFMMNSLSSREEVLQWYLELNSGGVIHSESGLARVRQLLKVERGQS